jgi:hypothetical protein
MAKRHQMHMEERTGQAGSGQPWQAVSVGGATKYTWLDLR